MMYDLTFLLGNRIKELRKSKKFTQDSLAELIDIDAKHLSRIECGKTQPSLSLLRKIATVFEIDISELFKTQHIKTKTDLISEINLMLENSDLKAVQLYYKILMSFK